MTNVKATNRARPDAKLKLRDEDIVSSRVNRRSFLTRAVAAGSIAVGAAMTAACPGGSSDGADSDSQE